MKILVTIIAGWVLALVVIFALANRPSDFAKTYDVCYKAHNEISSKSERHCEELLDKNNLTFTCINNMCSLRSK